MFVAFSDGTESTIIALFGCAQDPAYWPNQGEVSASDARYVSYFNRQTVTVQVYLPQPILS
ncbi:hypothetical protein B0G82_4010 [Paraburkholderia sp. BL17N1]|nr:hypothetical protein B0G82_4010 [Paraburkholderia sp. BL17N1]